jgi:bifunctional DNA-binding transcriptional regulator/antitoxin component of YhaV-PrlF toxin-antitoxin module
MVRTEASETYMAKVTSKYQVTVPRMIADKYHIRPGDDIDWVAAGEVIRVIPAGEKAPLEDRASRLRLFDQATERHRRPLAPKAPRPRDRGWTREDLYTRGRPR